jgi:hypothetical protein
MADPIRNVDQNSLQACQLDNQFLPLKEGCKAITFLLDFTLADSFALDAELFQQRGFIGSIQTCYIDMGDSDVNMSMVFSTSNQRIIAKGRTQGFYTVIAPSPFKLLFTSKGGAQGVRVFFLNVPIPGMVWPTL